jgi:isopentenyl-diphosphate delta-isomerase
MLAFLLAQLVIVDSEVGETSMSVPEQVVLLDDAGSPVGAAPKEHVHSDRTALHLAFSCYLVDETGDVLLTRRSLLKKTWPGVWSNSFCGHPGPDEPVADAIVRRARYELGAEIIDLEVMLPDFRYRATDASGIVENEVCPVYLARLGSPLHPNAEEVSEWAWVSPGDLEGALEATPFVFSPWLALQFPCLLESMLFQP